jgi:hypothetical protein
MSRFKHWKSKCKLVDSSGDKVYFPLIIIHFGGTHLCMAILFSFINDFHTY